jgi:hypothetical protein
MTAPHRTTVEVDDAVLARAAAVLGTTGAAETVRVALELAATRRPPTPPPPPGIPRHPDDPPPPDTPPHHAVVPARPGHALPRRPAPAPPPSTGDPLTAAAGRNGCATNGTAVGGPAHPSQRVRAVHDGCAGAGAAVVHRRGRVAS